MKNIFTHLKETSFSKLLMIGVLILTIVCVIVFGPVHYKNYQDKSKKIASEKQQTEAKAKRAELESKISAVKKWDSKTQLNVGAKEIRFETKWQRGSLLYKFEVDLTEGNNDTRRNRNSYSGFIVDFLDSDGFKIFSFRIPLNNMTNIMDEKMTLVGLSTNEKIDATAEEYLKFQEWSIGWNF